MNPEAGFNPLTNQHLAVIDQGCAECARARDYLAKLRAVGHPTDTQQQTVDAAYEYLTTVKKIFFPSAT